jgi:hypothetical protein
LIVSCVNLRGCVRLSLEFFQKVGLGTGGFVIIRAEQMRVFEQAARRRFEEEMVAHSKDFSPRLCEVIGDEQLRVALRSAMKRAEDYGFTNRGPMRLFIEMMFLCGSAFDTDPQYQAVGEALRSSVHQMVRAQQIHEAHIDYLERVSGPGATNVRAALGNLLAFAQMPLTIPPDDLVGGLFREMNRMFPQKVAYTGEAGLTAIIHEGIAEARRYAFTTVRQETLVVVLMFAFGHGCTDDPLYPWIAGTLRDDRIVSPAARAERLERKAVTWLEHVLARPRPGSQA